MKDQQDEEKTIRSKAAEAFTCHRCGSSWEAGHWRKFYTHTCVPLHRPGLWWGVEREVVLSRQREEKELEEELLKKRVDLK